MSLTPVPLTSDMQPANAAMMMTIQTILFMTYSHTFVCQLS